MENRANEIKAGIFIILSVIILAVFLVVILGLNRWEDKANYRCRFGYVGGIEKGSLVRFAGMEVGIVTGFSLPRPGDTRVEVLLEIKKDTPVRGNSEAFLSTIGLMGAYYIEITPGTVDAELLKPGALLSGKDVAGIAQMTGPMTDVTSEATILLKRLNDVLNDDNRRNMSEMLISLNRITAENAGNMRALMENVNRLTENLNQTVLRVNSLIAANDSSLHDNMVQLQNLMAESQKLAQQMSGTLQNVDKTLVENKAELKMILENSVRLTANLQEFSQTIKEQPWNLVRKNYPEERKLP